jgi:ribosomal protein S21
MSIIIKANPKDTNDSIIKRFLKQVTQEQVIQEYRDLEYHKSEGQKRQERIAEKRRKIARQRKYAA